MVTLASPVLVIESTVRLVVPVFIVQLEMFSDAVVNVVPLRLIVLLTVSTPGG
jgi:hypothetical protein